MKIQIITLLIVFCGALYPGALEAFEATVEISRFRAQEKPYIEMFLYILGSSVGRTADGTASVGCTYLIYRNGEIITGDKYNLIAADTTHDDFMDLRRHFLPAGEYRLEMNLLDNADTANTLRIEESFVVDATVFCSDIQLLAGASRSSNQDLWVKQGVRCVPLPYRYYHKAFEYLVAYHELYGMDVSVGDDFYVRYAIAPQRDPADILVKSHKRLSAKPVIPLIHKMDIRGLGSGEYVLSMDVFTRDHKRIAGTTADFVRSNPEGDAQYVELSAQLFANSFTLPMSADSVRYALKAIAPIVEQDMVDILNFLVGKGELENQKRFLHQFWVDIDPDDPQAAYARYMEVAHAIDQMYHSGLGYGFETDRGHIYLRYGSPDDKVFVEDEPSAPPYEIWIYYDFPRTNQSNVKFLFYDPSLSNHFELLHSTAIGEVQNRRWEQILYSDALTETESGDLIDALPVADSFHRRAREYFTDY